MTLSSAVGVVLTLALLLALVALTTRLLRRVSSGAGGSARPHQRLQVLQRVALGPRQGIAIVRVGEQLLAVSVGEGGVRTLAELEESPEAAPAVASSPAPQREFAGLVRDGLRTIGIGAALLVLAVLPPSETAQAQAPAQAPAARSAAPTDSAARRQKSTPAPATRPRTRLPVSAAAPTALGAVTQALPQLDLSFGGDTKNGGLKLSGTVGIVVLLGMMTLLPALLLLMTSFTRILIVLHFVKQALGTQTAPPAQLLTALALLLTGFVMSPTLAEVNRSAVTPWMNGQMEQTAMMSAAVVPFRQFMLRQTRDQDLATFIEMSDATAAPKRPEEVSTVVLMSAFVTSELRTSFQLGFVLFLPFIIIDLVVSSVLMSMGMFMLPPAMISLPFKLLLFVLVDGWSLLVQSLVASFR